MTYAMAQTLLAYQDKRLSKWKDVRFIYQGWEYRANYVNGFAPLIGLDRRKVGKRYFQYFTALDVSRKTDVTIEWVQEEIQKILDYVS